MYINVTYTFGSSIRRTFFIFLNFFCDSLCSRFFFFCYNGVHGFEDLGPAAVNMFVHCSERYENETMLHLPSATTSTLVLVTLMRHHPNLPSLRAHDQPDTFAWCPAVSEGPCHACIHPRQCPWSSNQHPQSQGAQLLAFTSFSFLVSLSKCIFVSWEFQTCNCNLWLLILN